MRCLDSTFIIDYLAGREAVETFLADHEDMLLGVPVPALFEAYAGGARLEGQSGIDRIDEGLSWAEPIPFDATHAREAAAIDAELATAGTPLNVMDVLIAGTARSIGATVVTRDVEFDRVDGLSVERY